jgi:tetratricopeptide (TPR) repeat protein
MSNPYAAPSGPPSGAPTVRPMSWPGTAVNFAVLASTVTTCWLLVPSVRSIWVGAALYLAYSVGSRSVIARAHRQGIRLVRRAQFEQAIPYFAESERFFSRHAWIDRFRAIIMLSPAAMGYREMALCNMAFCYPQIGQGAKAKQLYHVALAEYPSNALARTALRMIESGERIATSSP